MTSHIAPRTTNPSEINSYSRLNGIKPCHLHLQQAVFPVIRGHPRVVNATGDVTERFPILDKGVGFIINPKTPLRYILYTKLNQNKKRHGIIFFCLGRHREQAIQHLWVVYNRRYNGPKIRDGE